MRGFLALVTLTGCLQTAELPSSPPPPEGPVCGDGICDIGELAVCPADCDARPTCNPTSLGSDPVDLTATTAGAPSSPDFASCGDGAEGPTRTYTWTPPATGRYDVTATAAFPVVVDVLQGGCFGAELGCIASQSTVSVALHGGESIAIAVTGLAGASGEFHLQITREAETCGNGACELGEDCSSCPSDCGACPVCGDGVCNGGETCDSCPGDCGTCATCGDGVCDAGEDCNTCSTDCGACTTSYCGDGTCDAGEDCNSCASDCGTCASYCGDGSCDSGEDCNSCSADCGSCDDESRS